MRNTRGYGRRAVVLITAVAGLIVCAAPSSTSSGLTSARAVAPSWSLTGNLNTPRVGFTATLLQNGKVLVAGGSSADGLLVGAELYDPATGAWSPTGSLNAPRVGHSATLLHNGKVLVAGGWVNSCCLEPLTNIAEIYDPATGTWSLTGNLNFPRVGHTATLLPNGNVLFAGGGRAGAFSATNTAELYDPHSGTWSFTGNLNGTRVGHSAALLRDGRVLVVGGCGDEECFFELSSAELYDPNTGAWSHTGSLNGPRYGVSAAITLPNGEVLLPGGADPFITNKAELYDPATGRWSFTGSLLRRRSGATVTLLPGGQVLVAGGGGSDAGNPNHILESAELYDPAAGVWHTTASLNTARTGHTATLLLNGKVLVVGGFDRFGTAVTPLQSAELYDSGISPTVNPIDNPQFFVRQHYLDFLGREPDAAGLNFWTNEITSCGGDAQCAEAKRVNVSAAFFLSIENQETGFLAHRTHKVAFGDLAGKPVPLTLGSFHADQRRLADKVIVGAPGWPEQLEANKTSYFVEFVQRPAFIAVTPPSLTAEQYVDALFARARVLPTPDERGLAVAFYGGGGVLGRAAALRSVAESPSVRRAELNRAFVLAQYFGYLRRDPDAPGFDGQADPQFLGYHFWLGKLDQFNGNYVDAEMVRAFITSIEYRRRFGQ